MITEYALLLEEQYMPYAITDDKKNIIGFTKDAPKNALLAAKEHILMNEKFDDVTNYQYWDDLIVSLGLDKI